MTTRRTIHSNMVLGLMSGTSLDGITAALARFTDGADGTVTSELIGFRTVSYSADQSARLQSALRGTSAREYCRLAVDLGHWFAGAALELLDRLGVATADVDAIASHGQTVWHEPGHSSWQLGDPATIAERTGISVVHDFRARDIAAGGQGAPLVPMADRLLFADPTGWRALQNLGGIGNVTVVPPAGSADDLIAFDTGPGVAVVDAVFRTLRPGLPFDDDGRLAAAGTPVVEVVDDLLERTSFFAMQPPRSTGRELFNDAFVERLMTACRSARPGCSDADLMATAVSLTARSIGDCYRKWVPAAAGEVLLSGGGARNGTLAKAIAGELRPRRTASFESIFFDGEAKEAVAFALLGHLYLGGRPGNIPSATGARGPRLLGSFTPA